MQFKPTENMRGVWGLEDRSYTDAEIEASFHLRSAKQAGAFEPLPDDAGVVSLSVDNPPRPEPAPRKQKEQ